MAYDADSLRNSAQISSEQYRLLRGHRDRHPQGFNRNFDSALHNRGSDRLLGGNYGCLAAINFRLPHAGAQGRDGGRSRIVGKALEARVQACPSRMRQHGSNEDCKHARCHAPEDGRQSAILM